MYAGIEVFKQAKRRFADVTVEGHKFRIRSLTERERSNLELASLDDEGKVDIEEIRLERVRTIIAHVCNGDGLLVMTDEHADMLLDADSAVTGGLYEECKKLSKLGRYNDQMSSINAKKNASAETSD